MSRGHSSPPRRPWKSNSRKHQTILSLERMEERVLLVPRIVNSVADTLTVGTLRQALTDAVAGDTIDFQIPTSGPHTIKPATALPPVPASVVFTTSSQAGARANSATTGSNATFSVMIDGSNLGPTGVGLTVSGDGAVVRGLSFVNFQTAAIVVSASNVTVAGNWIGLDTAGANAANGDGIRVQNNASGVTIGGVNSADRNVISGNTNAGLSLTTAVTAVTVANNYVGTNPAGTSSVANGTGVLIDGPAGLSIGGSTPNAQNVISGNSIAGIDVKGANNRIIGNHVGLNASGTGALTGLPATGDGIIVNGVAGTTIGGNSATLGNSISGNVNRGVWVKGAGTTSISVLGNWIGLDKAGTAAVPNSVGIAVDANVGTGLVIGGSRPNIISGNTAYSIRLAARGTKVAGNWVGLDSTGNSVIASTNGLVIDNVADVTIGGTSALEGNTISGATQNGVLIRGAGSTGARVLGNVIGLNASATAKLPNKIGVMIEALALIPSALGDGAIIGGSRPNTISGNTSFGIDVNVAEATISGNLIGLNGAGNAALGNGVGVRVNNVSGTSIGGLTAAERNIISGNADQGVWITGAGSTGTVVKGNYIGTSTAGDAALSNSVGVKIDGPTGLTVGGSSAADRNVISGNTGAGIEIRTAGNKVAGNYIGTDSTGLHALSNAPTTGDGVKIDNVGTVTIGGAVGEGNVISGNRGAGVHLVGASAGATSLRGNIIGLDKDGAIAIANSIGLWIDGPTGMILNGSLTPVNTISGNSVGVQFDSSGNSVVGLPVKGNGIGILVNNIGHTTIGGASTSARNTISGNSIAGIDLRGINSSTTVIQGNWIGLDDAGTGASGNSIGIRVDGPTGYTLDGSVASTSNTISGNTVGLSLATSGVAGNSVIGTIFGRNAALDATVANGTAILIDGSSSNTVGGDTTSESNMIVGSTVAGVRISGAGADLNQVIGNVVTGNAVGVRIESGGKSNTIGGTLVGMPNTITGSTIAGVEITGAGSSLNRLVGSTISSNSVGVLLGGGATGNTVGGLLAGERNSISGNALSGVEISGSATSRNIIAANTITSNVGDGVFIHTLASANTIGGSTASARNLISTNGLSGIVLASGASDNLVQGNDIGTNSGGNGAAGNTLDGVRITWAASDPGSTTGNSISGNLISGNSGHGIQIGGLKASINVVSSNSIGLGIGGTALGNALNGILLATGASNNSIGSGNLIAANGQNGIEVSGGASGNLVTGNAIGTDANGTSGLGNTLNGVLLTGGGTSNNRIGIIGDGNTISGNTQDGVRISGSASANQVLANRIGTTADGVSVLANGVNGVSLLSPATENSIGGQAAGSGNLISGNEAHGVSVTGLGATNNFLGRNTIGLNSAGDALPNGLDGVSITDAPSNTIGPGNVISESLGRGIVISGAQATRNLISGSLIGTDETGSLARANSLGGILIIAGASLNTVGGSNTIAFNGASGVEINNATSNVVSGNSISSNAESGVLLTSNASGNRIGGGNTITSNAGYGVHAASSGNSIGGLTPNLISGNSLAGVQLDGASNTIAGNWIGLNFTGDGAFAASQPYGVVVNGVAGSVIGGITANDGNTIAGNLNRGLWIRGAGTTSISVLGNMIGLPASGTTAAGLPVGILVDSDLPGGLTVGGSRPNTISGNAVAIDVLRSGTRIAGNWIGLNRAGNGAVANDTTIRLNGSANVSIGGMLASERNLISGNSNEGLLIADAGNTGTIVLGNWIGTDATGISSVGNQIGIRIATSAPANLSLGGASPNIISGNALAGIQIDRSTTKVAGNWVGLSATGNGSVPNAVGLIVNDAASVTVGGSLVTEMNVISGNAAQGLLIRGAGSSGVSVIGNRVGTNPTATVAVPNGVGIGIATTAPAGMTIGGAAANTISGNSSYGIEIDATGVAIVGNLIGLNASGGGPIPNQVGLVIDSAANVTVGGASGRANTISGNSNEGVLIRGATSGGASVSGNVIGTDSSGLAAVPNSIGIRVASDAPSGLTLGGSVRNTISGNSSAQIVIDAAGTAVINNWIGLNLAGTAAPTGTSASADGVVVNGSVFSPADVTIGGTLPGTGNTIGGLGRRGIAIAGIGAARTSVWGNWLGTNATGTSAVANAINIQVLDSNQSTAADSPSIGGTASGQGNVISGASNVGVDLLDSSNIHILGNSIGTNPTGATAIANSVGVSIHGRSSSNRVASNLISGNSTGTSNNGTAGVIIAGVGASLNLVSANTIGLNATGGVLPNGQGVVITAGAQRNIIGGAAVDDGNTISGNLSNGILLSANASANEIVNNRIGTDAAGLTERHNSGSGIVIDGARDTEIGRSGQGNVIAGNSRYGVEIRGAGSTGNVLLSNRIGLAAAASGLLPNTLGGVIVVDASDNSIESQNQIHGGSENGIVLSAATRILIAHLTSFGGANGLLITDGSANNTVGPDNHFENNRGYGVVISRASNNTISGASITGNITGGILVEDASANRVGGGTVITDNAGFGVNITGTAIDNTVGGATPNTISGNVGNGVQVGAGGNLIAGNVIGLNALGSAAPNANGIVVNNVGATTIGGTISALHNTIAGNTGDGILITGSAATRNRVWGNTIGLSGLGGGNGGDGIEISGGASNNSVGGNASERNVITVNAESGIEISAGSPANRIIGNYVGLDSTGLPGRSNSLDGITINEAGSNFIALNVVSSNGRDGIRVIGNSSSANSISGNTIGLNAAGTALGNRADGIRIVNASNNQIGPDNRVSSNSGNGVEISDGGATGNRISKNTISNNSIGGILITTGATGNTIDLGNVVAGNLSNGLSINSGSNLVIDSIFEANGEDGIQILGSASNTIEGNTVGSNRGYGFEIFGADSKNNLLRRNSITGNSRNGIGIVAGSSATRIDGNLIEANSLAGVLIDGTTDNIFQGLVNTISGNARSGIEIVGAGARRNRIEDSNIAGNTLDGVLINAGATANTVGIRTMITGNLRNGVQVGAGGNTILASSILGNKAVGVLLLGATNTLVGSTISGNQANGVEIRGTNASGIDLSSNLIAANFQAGILINNASNIRIGLSGLGNSISGNLGSGVSAIASSGISVLANLIEGSLHGIKFEDVLASTIGAGNVLISNTEAGVLFVGVSRKNLIVGTSIGVDLSGAASPNGSGIVFTSQPIAESIVSGNTIGGLEPAQRNLIAGNTRAGVDFWGDAVTENLIIGNLVGLNAIGLPVPNGREGISFRDGANRNSIGGESSGAANVISANGVDGVALSLGATENLVVGNLVGTSTDGMSALGNGRAGIAIDSASGNTVFRNTISGNLGDGLEIRGAAAAGNMIRGNVVGLARDGRLLGNQGDGVFIINSAANTIGGSAADDFNVVSGNFGNGIQLAGDATSNAITNNRIGLDLAGQDSAGNLKSGIRLDGTSSPALTNNSITLNRVAGNKDQGIQLVGGGVLSNLISLNWIGLNIADAIVGNGTGVEDNGIQVADGPGDNLIDRNTISGSAGNGIQVAGVARTNTFSLNAVLGNAQHGVWLLASSHNQLVANLISANGQAGVALTDGSAENTLTNNTIGLGGGAVDLGVGNGDRGVVILDSSGNTLGSNFISANRSDGLLIGGANSRANSIFGNVLGLDATGQMVNGGQGSDGRGVVIADDASANSISGNLISGFASHGVHLAGGAFGNSLTDNKIGTDSTGQLSRGNRSNGIAIEGATTKDNLIGPGNLISGNRDQGLIIAGGANANRVMGNFIGTNADGTASLPNSLNGVLVVNAINNTIGGDASRPNLISGNGQQGVLIDGSTSNVVRDNRIGTDAGGTSPVANLQHGVLLANSSGNIVGPNNLISGNQANGIWVLGVGASNNAIVGNTIGLSSDGFNAIVAPRLAIPGAAEPFAPQYGIEIDLASNITIGGPTPSDRNVISGNGDGGIRINGDGSPNTARGNIISGNLIGTSTDGRSAAQRAFYNDPERSGHGIILVDSAGNTIGSSDGARNVISGNPLEGIYLIGGQSTNNIILRNYIGLDVDGVGRVPNRDGLVIRNAPANVVHGNVISGNIQTGITLASISNDPATPGSQPDLPGSPGLADGQIITENLIGPAADGSLLGTADNILGNRQGIFLNAVQHTLIISNVISGNTQLGVQLFSSLTVRNVDRQGRPIGFFGNQATQLNTLQSNSIGVGPDGSTAVPNGQGVFINDAWNNVIGGQRGQGNLISGNIGVGIQIMGDSIGIKPRRGAPVQNNPQNQVMNNTIGFGRTGGGFVPLPNDVGVFINGSRNTIDPSNVIGTNKRGTIINRLPNYGPTVDRVETPTPPNPTDTTPITEIVVAFGQYVDPVAARNPANYRIQKLGRRGGAGAGTFIGIKSVEFDVVERQAHLILNLPDPSRPTLSLSYGDTFRITVVGTPRRGISSRGVPKYFLDGRFNSQAGVSFVTSILRGKEVTPANPLAAKASLGSVASKKGPAAQRTLTPSLVDQAIAQGGLSKGKGRELS